MGIIYHHQLQDKQICHHLLFAPHDNRLKVSGPETDLPLLPVQVALQADRVREEGGVPGEVTLPVRVFDVQPDHIIRDVMAVEPSVHGPHIRIVVVVPATLVVPEGKQGGEGLIP